MSDKIVKLAVIRENDTTPCPFGLNISFACNTVGELIYKMAPLDILGEDLSDEEKKQIAKANERLFLWKAPQERCPYAGKLFPKNESVVECNWGSNAPGVEEKGALVGSPFYYKNFSGVGLDGLYTFPLGFYADTALERGLYYGSQGFTGFANQNNKDIIKNEELEKQLIKWDSIEKICQKDKK